MDEQRATVREVAERADVSQATAARALGGYGYVSDSVRRRVKAAAEELGYVRNALAGALASGRSRTVGLIVGDVENPFFAALARGVADVVESEGCTLLLANSDEDIEHERLAAATLHANVVDGLIAAPVSGTSGDHLVAPGRPLVLVDRTIRGLKVDSVTVANLAGARTAVDHLLSLGYSSIGVVTDPPLISSTSERLRGYRQALAAAGLPVDDELMSVGAPTRQGGYDAAMALLAGPNRPRAIFTTNNFMTAGAMNAVRSLGLRIPTDVALVGFDDLDWTTLVEPQITVVAQPVLDVGRAAGERVLARIAGDQRPPRRVRLPTELIVRESCGERPRQRAQPSGKRAIASSRPAP